MARSERQSIRETFKRAAVTRIPTRLYFQSANSDLDDLYRQSLPEQPAESRKVERTRTVKGDATVELGVGSASGETESQTVTSLEFPGEETTPARRAAALEQQLKADGKLQEIDFTSDEPLLKLLDRLAKDLRTIGINLSDEITSAIRKEWKRNAPGMLLADREDERPELNGFVSVKASFTVESSPTSTERQKELRLRAEATGYFGAHPLFVTAHGQDVYESALTTIVEGRSIEATVIGKITSARRTDSTTVTAVYSYWS